MEMPTDDQAEVREQLASADRIGAPPADYRYPIWLEPVWSIFLAGVQRPHTDLHSDPEFFFHHWHWPRGKDSIRYVAAAGLRVEVRSLVWRWTHGPIPSDKFARAACGWDPCVAPSHLRLRAAKMPHQKLSAADKLKMIRLAKDLGSFEQIAAHFGVSPTRVRTILKVVQRCGRGCDPQCELDHAYIVGKSNDE